MRLRRGLLIILGCAVLSFSGLLVLSFNTTHGGTGKPYGILSVADSLGESTVLKMLSENHISSVISPSTEWVYINDFNGLRPVPLSQYGQILEPYDLRNDGYAEQLLGIFHSSGQQRFFIPLGNQLLYPLGPNLSEKIQKIFKDVPYSLGIQQPSRGSWVFVLLFLTAAGVSLFFSKNVPVTLVVLLPLFFFSQIGPITLALSAPLLALSQVYTDPLREFFRSLLHKEGSRPFLSADSLKNFGTLIGIVFVGGLGLSLLSGTSPLLFLLALMASLGARFTYMYAEETIASNRGHHRFIPLTLFEHSPPPLEITRFMVPLTLAAVLALVFQLFFFFPGKTSTVPGLLHPENYAAHLAFQEKFSLTPLTTVPEKSAQDGYFSYHLGSDGLVDSKPDPMAPLNFQGLAIPPLEQLLFSYDGKGMGIGPSTVGGDSIAVIIMVIINIPLVAKGIKRRRQRGAWSLYNDKRMAA
jgi:hypothetical protein